MIISFKGEQSCPPGQILWYYRAFCYLLELQKQKLEICKTRDYRPKKASYYFAFGPVSSADVATFGVPPPQGKDKKVAGSWSSWLNPHKSAKSHNSTSKGRIWLRWYKVNAELSSSFWLFLPCSFSQNQRRKYDFWKILQNEANFRELSLGEGSIIKLIKALRSCKEWEADMLNDFLSGKGLMLLYFESWKGRYGAEGEGARSKKARGKKSKRRKERLMFRKIATES